MRFLVIDPNARPMLVVGECNSDAEAMELAVRYSDRHGSAICIEVKRHTTLPRPVVMTRKEEPGTS